MSIQLIRMAEHDLPLTLAWAQIKMIWEFMPTTRRDEELTWEMHHNWWQNRDRDRFDWMVYFNGRPVGAIHVNKARGNYPEVGLYIGETGVWRKGIGREALRRVIGYCAGAGRPRLQAVIHPRNRRSIRLFAGMGFKKIGRARKGQDLYELDLSTTVRSKSTISKYQGRNRRSYQPSPA